MNAPRIETAGAATGASLTFYTGRGFPRYLAGQGSQAESDRVGHGSGLVHSIARVTFQPQTPYFRWKSSATGIPNAWAIRAILRSEGFRQAELNAPQVRSVNPGLLGQFLHMESSK